MVTSDNKRRGGSRFFLGGDVPLRNSVTDW